MFCNQLLYIEKSKKSFFLAHREPLEKTFSNKNAFCGENKLFHSRIDAAK